MFSVIDSHPANLLICVSGRSLGGWLEGCQPSSSLKAGTNENALWLQEAENQGTGWLDGVKRGILTVSWGLGTVGLRVRGALSRDGKSRRSSILQRKIMNFFS